MNPKQGMRRWGTFLPAVLVLGLFLGRYTVELPVAQIVAPTPDLRITEEEMDLYITVYAEMQVDHGLTIDAALARHGETLERFRDIERRVQTDQRLVDRVRLELLNKAKASNAWGDPAPAGEHPEDGDEEPTPAQVEK